MPSLIQRLRALTPAREQLEANPWLGRLGPRLSDPKLWQWSRRSVATGLAVGVFVGLLIPVAQILFAALAAIALRVNLPVAAAGTLITNPLTVPPIYFAAYQLGAWATGAAGAGETVAVDKLSDLWNNMGSIGTQLFAGLGITAVAAAAASYLLISQIWVWRVAARRRERHV